MESKLQELTKKIYEEGVEKANAEAKTILDDANNQAKNIIEKAKKEAESIVSKAKADSQQMDEKVKSELKLAGSQAMTSLKQVIVEIISSKALTENIKENLNEKDFVKDIIKEIVSKWDTDSRSLDLNVILPAKSKEDLLSYYKNKAKDILDKGLELKFEERMEGGFKIGPKDNSFILSFTEKDFESFFQSFLRPKTREILFS